MDIEILFEERPLQVQLVIMGDDFVHMRFGSVKATALLYLHHHHGNRVDDVYLFFRRLLLGAG